MNSTARQSRSKGRLFRGIIGPTTGGPVFAGRVTLAFRRSTLRCTEVLRRTPEVGWDVRFVGLSAALFGGSTVRCCRGPVGKLRRLPWSEGFDALDVGDQVRE